MWAGITGVIIGLLVGGTAAWLWLRRSSNAETVANLKRENEQFREEVNEHFVQTAELINQLTDSYKAVFDHLSEGAEKLVDPEVVRERMPQVSDEEVRLKRLGAPRAAAPADEEAGAGEAGEADKSDGERGDAEVENDQTDGDEGSETGEPADKTEPQDSDDEREEGEERRKDSPR